MSWTYKKTLVTKAQEIISDRAYVFLNPRKLDDALIDCTSCDKPKHSHLPRLAQTMGTVHCLRIVRGIPVMIIEYDCICRSQIDP